MFFVESYPLAIVFCVITMLCWGSWANTQKLAAGKWRYELFYWDYVIGIFLFSLLAALTMGSTGEQGRSFLPDLQQASGANIGSALLGGIIFNLANILLSSAIAIAGMSVAFPVGIGLALVVGVIINYANHQKGDPLLLFAGVALVSLAIILNAIAYRKKSATVSKAGAKGIVLSIVAGLLMSFFYPFVAGSMDLDNFVNPEASKMTPYTASVIFAAGILLSNFLFNTIMMKRPLEGASISYTEYFKGRLSLHFIGILGGSIWALGNLFNLIAAGKAGPAISYGLGQGATLVAAVWGVLIWKEFAGSSKQVKNLIAAMFLLFVIGLGLVIAAGL
ncbi:GRP family sugar transporter [Pseudobacter ginsenosidimutans]|uniref:Glucose uptake protein n=1 Tax=Pseudobacter ginsenosidimutans TaxID=661488 RepID=A0A4Q7MQZ2_9BACT|nr:GRP family sugar transporter [Pseudobacter ginsenosidimutans]QEC42007.1 multidrug DMT transporter permease [Pseudobacter ginsenosidimutans]RZS71162.1 glucose uptake protein [Pseudobacter ginsenosidimutans]